MLEGLKDKFNEQLAKLQKEDLGNRHAFDTVVMDLRGAVNLANSDIGLKSKAKALLLHTTSLVAGGSYFYILI